MSEVLIGRTLVDSWFEAEEAVPLAALIGPAGSGKTSALRAWARDSGTNPAWLSGGPGLAVQLGVLRGMSAPVIVIDDAHLAEESDELTSAVEDLIADDRRLIMLGRSEPPIMWQRWRGRGAAVALGFEELLFNRDELALFAGSRGHHLSSERLDSLHELTSGWPALAALVLEESGRLGGGGPWPRGDAERYVRFEVLGSLEPSLLRFMTELSTLIYFNADLVSATLGTGAEEKLHEVWRDRLLLLRSVTTDWFRFPPLVARILQTHPAGLTTDAVREIHHATSLFLERAGLWDCALSHMLEADPEAAVHQLVRMLAAEEPFGRSESGLRWFSKLPDELSTRPTTILGLAMAMVQAGFPAEADTLLERTSVAHWHRTDQVAEYHAVRAMVHRVLLRHSDSIAAAERSLEILAGADCSRARAAYLRLIASDQLVEIAAWQGRISAAQELSARTQRWSTECGYSLSLIHGSGMQALLLMDSGEVRLAKEAAEATVRQAERQCYQDTHLTAEAHLVLGLAALETDAVDDALKHLDTARTLSLSGLFPTTVLRVGLATVDATTRAGQHVEADRALDQLTAGAAPMGDLILRARAQAVAESASHDRSAGQGGQLPTVAEMEAWPLDVIARFPSVFHASTDPALRRALEHRCAAEAGPLAAVLGGLCRLVDLQGERSAAIAEARQVMRTAEHAGLWRTLLRVGAALDGLRQAILGANATRADGPSATFATRFANERTRMHLRNESLFSPREVEVIRYLGTRLTLTEIAAELYISENTVKTHVRHIYQKLDVQQRGRAAERLADLGYLVPPDLG